MKKAAAFAIASFYLFITTGMFVCTTRCFADYLSAKEQAGCCQRSSHENPDKKDSGGGCCTGHYDFAVKENIAPAANKMPANTSAIRLLYDTYLCLDYYVFSVNTSLNGHSPPYPGGFPVFMKTRSILI